MPHSPDHQAPTTYQIRVAGHLDQHWSSRLGGLTLTHEDDATTKLAGVLPDQAALHGVLTTIRDLNLTLVALARLDGPALATGRLADDVDRRHQQAAR